jgi:Uma2 family endonuclease
MMVADTVAPWAEPVLFTADDLAALPDDAWHYELVEGRLVRMPPTGVAHGDMTARLVVLLRPFVTERGLGTVLTGEPGFVLNPPGEPETVLAPGVAFVSAANMSPEDVRAETGFSRAVPEFVVEVASPSQHRPELAAKAQRWLQAGVNLVWIVWPVEHEVDVWVASSAGAPRTLGMDDELDGGDTLPGFEAPISALWN